MTPQAVPDFIDSDTPRPIKETLEITETQVVESLPVEEVPVEEFPVEEVPVEEVPVKEVPVKEVLVKELPVKEVPVKEHTPTAEPTPKETVQDAKPATSKTLLPDRNVWNPFPDPPKTFEQFL